MIATEDLYRIYQQFPHVQTDTRKLRAGELYFALKGENFNGNLFAEKAIQLGASYAVVDEAVNVQNPDKIIRVDNVLKMLQDLARIHRLHFDIPFIAITGSNGKTTTKELIHSVLSHKFKTYTTQGNLNNHIGIPLTILGIKKDAEMAVLEMGANHLNEIKSYCQYSLPTHGLITNTGKAHLEGFGDLEGVRKGKGELYDFLRGHRGTAFVMWDYEYLREMSKGIPKIIKYGTSHAEITGVVRQSLPFLSVDIISKSQAETISTKLAGDYNLPNVLAAIAVGHYFKVTGKDIKTAIENYTPSNGRSQLIEMNSNKIILDAYNANPSSMKAAIENFAKINAAKKILILGAMAELGAESLAEHEYLVELISQNSWHEVVLVGGDFLKLKHPYLHFENSAEVKTWLKKKGFQETYILIKGSRNMQMEKILEN